MKIQTIIFAAMTAVLAGCASSAADIKVPTVSMDEAWKSTKSEGDRAAEGATGRVVGAVLRQEQPLPVVSAPDIRMAYIFQATDQEGNMHYGSWVALPIDSFKWLMPEGARVPMAPPAMPVLGR